MDRNRSVEECEAELRQLQEENDQLRQSSSGFADLAERLMRTLEVERHLNRSGRHPGPGRATGDPEDRAPLDDD